MTTQETQSTPQQDPGLNPPNRNAGASEGVSLTQEHLDFINRLQGIIQPSQSQQPNPAQKHRERVKTLTSEVDHAAVENLRRGGSGMPLTSKLAYELEQTSDHLIEENEALKKRLANLEKQTSQTRDPHYRSITTITDNAELMISDAVDALYGQVDKADPRAHLATKMKENQKESFHSLVHDHLQGLIEKGDISGIKALQKPSNLRNLISEFGEHVLPPKARDVLKATALANMPVDPVALYNEMREANTKAKEAKTPQEQRQWEDIATKARRRYLGTRIGRKK